MTVRFTINEASRPDLNQAGYGVERGLREKRKCRRNIGEWPSNPEINNWKGKIDRQETDALKQGGRESESERFEVGLGDELQHS